MASHLSVATMQAVWLRPHLADPRVERLGAIPELLLFMI
jgi:hypothetical protein